MPAFGAANASCRCEQEATDSPTQEKGVRRVLLLDYKQSLGQF